MASGKKITEGKRAIIISVLVTAICALLDWFWDDKYATLGLKEYAESVIRLLMGYFFPSFISLSITMLIQYNSSNDDTSGLNKNHALGAVIGTVFYGVVFILCISKYNLNAGIAFVVASIVYIFMFNRICLDEQTQFSPITMNNKKLKNKPNG